MPEASSGEQLCETCGKSRSNVTSITQWISVGDKCACASGGQQRMTPSSSFFRLPKVCKNCGGSIASGVGSMTQWVFRTVPCKCAEPEVHVPEQQSGSPGTSIDLDTLYCDDQPGVDIDAARFPLDRYIPLELLGTGQEGDVYKATDKLLRRRVCVKLLKTHKLSPEQVMRFQREAQTGSKLKHPNIAMTLDFGLTQQGLPYLVLEFCDGIPLDEFIQDESLELHTLIELMIQISEGMQHAHARGVLHRDLKTSNIVVLKYKEEQPVAKVVDFGLSVFADTAGGDKGRGALGGGVSGVGNGGASGTAGDAPRLTKSGSLIGTPSYMSPEHASGGAIDQRTDIYALGCIMFEMLTGRVPFEADSIVEVIRMQRESEVPFFKQIIANNDLPEEVEAIVRKALEKDPGKRFQTMGDLHQELRKLLIEHFRITPASLKIVEEGDLLKGALPVFRTASMQGGNKRLNRAVLIALVAVGSLGFLLFVCQRVLYSESVSSWPVKPPDGANPLDPSLDNISLNSIDKKRIASGRLGRLEDASSKFADELAQKAYGIEAETSGKELLEDSDPSEESDNVVLSLANTRVNKVEFARAARHVGLEMLDISGASGITAEGLMELRNLEKLRTLRMDGVKVGAAELEAVAELPIERLYLSNSQLSDAGCKILAKSKSLRTVDVSYNPVAVEGLKELSSLKTLRLVRFVKTSAGVKGRVALRATGWEDRGDEWFGRPMRRQLLNLSPGFGEGSHIAAKRCELRHPP